MKYSNLITFVITLLISPSIILISIVSNGRILPSLTNHETWTIEYTPMILSSLLGFCLAVLVYRKTGWRAGVILSCTLNLLIALFFTYTVLTLWGDKY